MSFLDADDDYGGDYSDDYDNESVDEEEENAEEEGEQEDEDDEIYEENEETTTPDELIRSLDDIPQSIPIIRNDTLQYIEVSKKEIEAFPNILNVKIPILLRYIDSRFTPCFMKDYEFSTLMQKRCIEFAGGEKSTIQTNGEIDSFNIALSELRQKRLPMFIRRPRKNGGSRIFLIDPNDDNALGVPFFNEQKL